MSQSATVGTVPSSGRMRTAVAGWAESERGRFGPWLAVGMVAGAAGYFTPLQEPPAWLGAGALAVAAALVGLGWRWAVPRGVACLLAAGALGLASAQWGGGRALPIEPLPSRAVVLTAVVRGVDVLPEGRRLVLEDVRLAPDQPALQRRIRVRMKRGDGTAVEAGDRVQVRALVRPPAPPAYPGAWDLQRDAYFNGLGGGGTALNPVVVLEHAAPSGLSAWVQGVRDAIGRRAMAALPGTKGAVAATLLTGSTLAIPAADRAAFRDSGLAHLLAVAGLHIGIVMGLFMLVARVGLALWPHAALHWPTKAIAALVALAAGATYLVLTGAHVPILRSFAMACLVTLGVVVGRRALSLRGLALGAAALVVIAPQEVVGVSFQMSFAAVLALIAGYEALRPLFAQLHGPGWRHVAAHGAALVVTSLLAGTASAPFAAYHFGHVQIYFIAANVVAVPLTALWVLPLGLLALVLMPFGLEGVAFVPMGWGIDVILWIARGVAGWPAATMGVPPMPGWGLVLVALGLAWLCLWRTRVRLVGVGVIAAGLLSPVFSPPPDMLVSNEGRLIALRGEDGWRLQSRPGAARFVRDAWAEHFGAMRPLAEGAGCDATTCRLGPVLMLRGAAHEAGCDQVTLVVSAEPARGVCRDAALLDRFTVWRDGAHAVWLGANGPTVLSDRAMRGARPWVPPAPVPRVRVPNLPMAATEPLPPEMETTE